VRDEVPFGTAEVTVEPVAQVISTPATVVARTYAATVRARRASTSSPGAATLAALDVEDGDGHRRPATSAGCLRRAHGALRQAEAARTSAR
jgi:hypothetical protein